MSSQIKPLNYGEPFFKEKRVFAKRFPNGFPVGPRTKARAAANRDMNKAGIDYCEIRIPGVCQGRHHLGWAHPTKSRYITTAKEWRTAAKSCAACHDYIEALPHSEMKKIVLDRIQRRKAKQPTSDS